MDFLLELAHLLPSRCMTPWDAHTGEPYPQQPLLLVPGLRRGDNHTHHGRITCSSSAAVLFPGNSSSPSSYLIEQALPGGVKPRSTVQKDVQYAVSRDSTKEASPARVGSATHSKHLPEGKNLLVGLMECSTEQAWLREKKKFSSLWLPHTCLVTSGEEEKWWRKEGIS